jgi:hypothetical protein
MRDSGEKLSADQRMGFANLGYERLSSPNTLRAPYTLNGPIHFKLNSAV